MEEVTSVASRELRHNSNRLVRHALEEYVARRKARAFENAMAEMARDPAIRTVSYDINRQFGPTEGDGLKND